MILNAYDTVDESAVNNSWVNLKYRKLYSKSMKYYPVYTFLKRYDAKIGKYEYFVALANKMLDNTKAWHSTERYGKSVKLSLADIWDYVKTEIKEPIQYVDSTLIEEDEDCVLYRVDF